MSPERGNMHDKLTVKQQAFCQAMYTPGSESFGNGTESARKAQYKGNDNTLATVAKENTRKPQIIAEKQRIQAIIEEELDLSRAGQHEKLQDAFDLAKTGKNPAAMTSAIREQNEMLGYHRDKAPNQEKMDAILARMTDEEREFRRDWEIKRANALSAVEPAFPKLNTG